MEHLDEVLNRLQDEEKQLNIIDEIRRMENIDKIQSRVEEVLSNDISNNKERIDLLLEIDADNVAELGKNSTSEERKKVKRNSLNIYRAIKKIDKVEGELLLKCVDK